MTRARVQSRNLQTHIGGDSRSITAVKAAMNNQRLYKVANKLNIKNPNIVARH